MPAFRPGKPFLSLWTEEVDRVIADMPDDKYGKAIWSSPIRSPVTR